MRCPACHQNIRIQGKFCPKCGEQIFGLPVHGAPPDHAAPDDFTPPPPVPSAPLVEPMGAPPVAAEASVAPPLYPPRPTAPIAASDYLLDFPQAPPAGDVLEVTLDDSGPSAIPAAGEQFAGKVCPYCRFPLKPGEAVQVCPSCATPHHLECWRENRGCTTYGCQSSPQVGGAQPATGAPQPGMAVAPGGYQAPAYGGDLPRAARALLEQELDRLATNALIFSLLWFLCGIPALIGLLTGISVLGQVKQSGLVASGAKRKAWIAIGISSTVLVIGIIYIVNLIGSS
jgi:hypothetical protein